MAANERGTSPYVWPLGPTFQRFILLFAAAVFFSLFFFLFQFVDVTREAIGRRLGQWGARLNDANYQSQSTLVGDTKTKQNKKGHTTRNADEADDKNRRQQKKNAIEENIKSGAR